MRDSVALPVAEPSRAGEARRIASALAERAGFDEEGRGKVALVATELATNLVRHAKGGELILSTVTRRGASGIEILSLDHGPGMADFARCRVDGFSTAGTPGNGLGAVARIADEFEAQTAAGQGSALLATLWATPPRKAHPGGELEWGGVCLPVLGEQECGDAWGVIEESSGCCLVMVADGLGHGPHAAKASAAAIEVLRKSAGQSPSEVLLEAHEALKGTRGAAVAIALVDRVRREVRFCGLGNIGATIVGPDSRYGLVSLGGTIGVEIRKPQEFVHPWPDGALLVMHSDGVASGWKLDRRSPLASRPPSLIAGVLYRDHARARDDSTAIVVRDKGGLTP